MYRLFFLAIFAMMAYEPPLSAQPAPSNWNYDSMDIGQDSWGELSPAYAACQNGTAQSPIKIDYTTLSPLPKLELQYRESNLHIQRKDYTMAMAADGDNALIDAGHRYHLEEIRLHSPSEHTVLEHFYPVEIQLIHRDAKGKLLILGIFAEIGGENKALQPLLETASSKTTAPLRFDPATLLPEKRGYYAYTGSLTIPPCTEGVEWRILKQPIQLSKQQLMAIGTLIGRNARLPQPIYLRIIKESKD